MSCSSSSSLSSSSSSEMVLIRIQTPSTSDSGRLQSQGDIFSRYSAAYNYRPPNALDSGPECTPAGPPHRYTAIFKEFCGLGFHQNLSWIMLEYCGVTKIAPSQLSLTSWGLIHAIQVLSDLSGIELSGKMVAGAFYSRQVEAGSRQFTLVPRTDSRSPVKLPNWLDSIPLTGEYFFVPHYGAWPPGLQLNWLQPGMTPDEPVERLAFPDLLFDLDEKFRDSRFLLHPDVVRQSSLASTDDNVVVPKESLEALIDAHKYYVEISSVSVLGSPGNQPDVSSQDTYPNPGSSGNAYEASGSNGRNAPGPKRRRL